MFLNRQIKVYQFKEVWLNFEVDVCDYLRTFLFKFVVTRIQQICVHWTKLTFRDANGQAEILLNFDRYLDDFFFSNRFRNTVTTIWGM